MRALLYYLKLFFVVFSVWNKRLAFAVSNQTFLFVVLGRSVMVALLVATLGTFDKHVVFFRGH
jgi:hypothetical protein